MLKNTRVTAFTVSELLRENQQDELKLTPLSPRLGLGFLKSIFDNSLAFSINTTS